MLNQNPRFVATAPRFVKGNVPGAPVVEILAQGVGVLPARNAVAIAPQLRASRSDLPRYSPLPSVSLTGLSAAFVLRIFVLVSGMAGMPITVL